MAYLLNTTGGKLSADVTTDFLTDEVFPTGVLAATDPRDIVAILGQLTLVSTIILGDHVIDNGLIVLSSEANAFWLCSGDPTGDYSTANGLRLASKSGVPFEAPEVAINGSSVISVAILDGSGVANGLCTHWAAVDTVNTRVLVHGSLDASAPISIGQAFRLPSFSIFVIAHE
jgi:hypothetical protein